MSGVKSSHREIFPSEAFIFVTRDLLTPILPLNNHFLGVSSISHPISAPALSGGSGQRGIKKHANLSTQYALDKENACLEAAR